jgi:hypothetical protein
MALPGSQGYPPPNKEEEGLYQITQLLFYLANEVTSLRSELHRVNTHLQTIGSKLR